MGSRRTKSNGSRTRRARSRRVLLPVAIIASVLAAAAVAALMLTGGGAPAPAGPPRAVIVDQLAETDANPGFVRDATRTLEEAGYSVDYVPSAQVTVSFYRQLPAHGYSFILLRSHAARNPYPGRESGPTSLGLFTAEAYNFDKYAPEVRQRSLLEARYARDGRSYFGIGAGFVTSSMQGSLRGATVVLMGCDGLATDAMAAAFVARGAKSFVSWDDQVTAAHTDATTSRLLEHLLADHLPAREAVARTMDDLGPDPTFGARLASYP